MGMNKTNFDGSWVPEMTDENNVLKNSWFMLRADMSRY